MAKKQTVQSENRDVVEYGSRRLIVVIGVMLATILQVLDATIVNVALPTIQGNLGANLDEGAWIITGYIIAAVIVIPLTPWLQVRFGRRNYYVAAIVGFTLMSLLCGLAKSFEEEVFFRVLQGACGGGLLPTGQAVLRDTFPPKDIGRSQVLVALGAILGPSIGPTLGGILTDSLSWNWVFFINIVPGTIAAVMLWTTLRDPATPRRLPVDVLGLGLLALGLGSLQYVLGEGERNDWFNDTTILSLAITSACAMAGFVAWELFGAQRPIVDLRILKRRTIWAGCLLAMALGFSLFGSIVITPQYTQGILNFTATLSGESILVRALAILACTPLVLVFLNRLKINPKVLLASGFILVVIANVLQAQVTTSGSDFWTFFVPLALGGVGFSQILAPLSVTVLSSVQGADTAKASSLLSLSQQLGGSISAAVLVTLLDRRTAFHQSVLATQATLANPEVARRLSEPGPAGALVRLYAVIVREATTLAFADAFWVLAAVALLLTPLVFLLKTKRSALSASVPAIE
jgi:DHA2 family multidrug resistance protein